MSHDHDHDHSHDAPQLSDEERLVQAAHIVLDGVGADLAGSSDDAVEDAFARLLEVDAVEVLLDEENDELELDMSPLMGAVLVIVERLVTELADRDGVTVGDVLSSLREGLDSGV